MELIDLIPEFNLYEDYWKIYTKQDIIEPQYVAAGAKVERSIIGAGAQIYGQVINCVLGAGVTVEEGTVVKDSIIMKNTHIGKKAYIEKAIIAENCIIGDGDEIGVGEEAVSQLNASIYAFGLATIGENTVIPPHVKVGKNTAIKGMTTNEDYPDAQLLSGGYIIKAGETS